MSEPPSRERFRLESDTLYAVIAAVGSSSDLDRVLSAMVELLTEATECHACFVYLRHGERLRMRAASRVYAHLVGRIELGLDDSLTGWVARHERPAFIREDALSDPRTKHVPELEEERFQSICAVPVPARSGGVLGAIVLHTAAPREFDEGVLSFLSHTASLVAGAIENARLLEESRRRVDTLTGLARLSQDVAAATRRDDLHQVATASVRALLRADACRLYRLDPESNELELAAADPVQDDALLPRGGATVLLDVLRRSGRHPGGAAPGDQEQSLLAVPLAVGHEDIGVLTVTTRERDAYSDEDDELLRTAASQVALALKRTELIERLTAENVTRDVFDALAADAGAVAGARARAAGCDLSRPHVVLHIEPRDGDGGNRAWPWLAERVETRLRRLASGAVCDVGRRALRAVVPLEAGVADLPALHRDLAELGAAEAIHIGVSDARQSAEQGARSLGEAADAARVATALVPAGGAFAYSELGAYRYLVHLPLDEVARDRHSDAVLRLLDYDRRRRARLVDTLEEYLRNRGGAATTARTLYVHPNTLRQRLDRIEKVSGLDLGGEDLLSLELAVKLVRLRGGPPAPAPSA